jgi:hypothetical protein
MDNLHDQFTDLEDEDVLTFEVSDDALEAAAGADEIPIRTMALPTYPPGYCCF